MIDKECATEIQKHALSAIAELSHVLLVSQNKCSDAEYQKIKRAVGIPIGIIATDLLDFIYAAYPEINHL